jgi:transcriptional regulator with XRE-family HTH domain
MKPKPPRTDQQRRGQRRARAIRHDLGAEITALRESSGVSMRALALAAGISPSTERAIEDRTHSPTIEVLARVAQILGAELGVRLYAGSGPRIHDHLRWTQSTRHVVAEFAELLAVAYPARHVDLLAAITGNAPWPGPGLV